jgi:hypothetical protein
MSAINIRKIERQSTSEATAKVSQNASNVVNKAEVGRTIVTEKESQNFKR